MMAFAVKRILNHTYVAVPAGNKDGDSYGRNVLAANRIPGLLACRVEHLDGKTMLLYDVTSRQSLKVYLEKRRVSAGIFRTILLGILRAAENLEEYLLDPGHFVLKIEYVFLDAAAEETGLIYDTGYEGDFFEGLKELAGELLANVPEDDHEAILLGYRFCHELDAPARDMNALLGLLAEKKRDEPQKEEDIYGIGPYEPFAEESGSLYGEETPAARELPKEEKIIKNKKQKRLPGLYAAVVTGVGLALVLLIYAVRTLMPAYPEAVLPPWLLAVPTAGIAAAFILFFLFRQKKSRKKGKKEGRSRETLREENLFPEGESDLYIPMENEKQDADSPYAWPGENMDDPETQILAAADGQRGRTARLIPEDVTVACSEIRLYGTETRIGKLPEAVDAVIASPVISRIHARVIKRENSWFLEDLNSRNGTYVNGKNTIPGGTPLADGDKVRFADEGFIFRLQ